MRETAVTTKLVKHLNKIPGCFARKRHGSAYSAGDPDVHICYRGLTLFIEMKVVGGELSELQAIMLQRWQDAGASCILMVWDASKKVFSTYYRVPRWADYAGRKIRPAAMLPGPDYLNVTYSDMEKFINERYEISRAN